MQATFLYAFRALRRGVVPECERAWLTTIARNVCNTQRRTSSRHPEDATELDLDRIGLAEPDRGEVGFMDDVRAALSSMPETQRRALVLREWHGVASNEIANDLHLSEPATHALLFRARKSFATAMSASGRPFAGLNIALLLEQLRGWAKPLLGGAAVKAAVVTTAAGVVVGGVVLEQRSDGGTPRTPASERADVLTRAQLGLASGAQPAIESAGASRNRSLAPRTLAPPAQRADSSTRAAVAPVDDDGVTSARSPKPSAEPPPVSPPTGEAPGSPTPAPPIEAPLPPPPVELPPIAGELPPIELPPPLEDALPPVELPPLDPLPPFP